MQIICISRGSYSKGQELAQIVAKKLDFDCLDRRELMEEATRRGIPVGRMELAMIKPHTFADRLALEKEHYKAFATNMICEKALQKNLVYHGRTGHLLLPGIDNVLRVRVVANLESRIEAVMKRLRLDRAKARDYIVQVEEDRRLWARSFYNVRWDESLLYDVIINTDHLSIENAATALCSMAEMPEFKFTPAARKIFKNILLSSRCRVALFDDERTFSLQTTVRADNGVVSVTYSPRQEKLSKHIPEILKEVPGIKEILCTMAQTSIMWIQEKFDPDTEVLDDIIEIARKWEAAVELVQMSPDKGDKGVFPGFGDTTHRREATAGESIPGESAPGTEGYTGGIEDDVDDSASPEDADLKKTYDRLITTGHAGGCHILKGSPKALLHSVFQGVQYSLVVVGNIFLSKGHAAQTRLTNELVSSLANQLKVPVVLARELKQQYLFGKKQLVQLGVYFSAVVVIYYLVFTNQIAVLEVLRLEGGWRFLSVGLLLLFVPMISLMWGTAARLLLKLIRFK
jgi:cytidylate kinase